MVHLLSMATVVNMLPLRPEDGHKGTFGHLVVIGGSSRFPGSVKLVCRAAYRSGVGLVTAAVPKTIHSIIATSLTETMMVALSDTEEGSLSESALEDALLFCETKSCVVVGPGLTTHPSTSRFARKFCMQCPLPMVLDADALNAWADMPERFAQMIQQRKAKEIIMTPHPGEMSRLTGAPTKEIQADRATFAARYAEQWNAGVVLKGKGTIIASPDGDVYINPTGNNGMATGGSGDVLAGIIGALLAQGRPAVSAACVGVYVHGWAGDLAAKEKSIQALIASDIIEALPKTWNYLERQRQCQH